MHELTTKKSFNYQGFFLLKKLFGKSYLSLSELNIWDKIF